MDTTREARHTHGSFCLAGFTKPNNQAVSRRQLSTCKLSEHGVC
uniref:Uncharacterized protein n=1 Tax=Anguilla anguilla TaxID=7936 RepID=A0A0E9QC95_ANGAN